MKIPFSQICRDYLALRGESPDLLPRLEEEEEYPVLTLRDELMVILLEAAEAAVLQTPSIYLDEIRELTSAPLLDDGGVMILRMPENYLKLHSLRMADWKEPVREPEPEGSLRSVLGANAPKWMICAERPMVTEHRDAAGISLRVYGTASVAIPREMLYVPRPEFDGENLSLPGAAYPALLRILVEKSRLK